MLGSVANHAWTEDALYLTLGKGGDLIVEHETKDGNPLDFKVTGVKRKGWHPEVKFPEFLDEQSHDERKTKGRPKMTATQFARKPLGQAFTQESPLTAAQAHTIMTSLGHKTTRPNVYNLLKTAVNNGFLTYNASTKKYALTPNEA